MKIHLTSGTLLKILKFELKYFMTKGMLKNGSDGFWTRVKTFHTKDFNLKIWEAL